MKRYNALNSLKIDLSKCGICEVCGRRFTDPACEHTTPAQVKFTLELDKQADYDQGILKQMVIRDTVVIEIAPLFEKLGDALETAFSIPEEMFPFIFRTDSEFDGCENDRDLYEFATGR